jgi:hypothetical protein
MKIHPMGTELIHSDGRTDRHTDKHDESFRNFANEHKNRLTTTIGVNLLFILFNLLCYC